jgi:transposase-like protein
MSIILDEKKLKELAAELAKDIKSEKDLSALSAQLLKLTVETALGAKMEEHLGYAKHDTKGRGTGNSRNGATPKTPKGDHGEVEIETPRERNGSFEPAFDYPPQIRKAIYTTNAIESLNSVIRKATKKPKLFPTDNAALKVVYLAINQASKKWTMPIQNWRLA